MAIEFLGADKRIKEIRRIIEVIAKKDVTVLLRGETGVGKEVAANLIHDLSERRDRKIVVVNCPAITETLAESELFGHKKGAFTGSIDAAIGLLRAADGGTVFLDEIGDMSPVLQLKLLRFLNDNGMGLREVRRVGGSENSNINVRVIAATNKNLEQRVKEGAFRQDLYFRIYGFPIHIPPLRERQDDIMILANHFLNGSIKISSSAIQKLREYSWPGNVRELQNLLSAIKIFAEINNFNEILPQHIEFPVFESREPNIFKDKIIPQGFSLGKAVTEFEKEAISIALRQANYVERRTARILNIDNTTLRNKRRAFGI